VDRTSIVLDEKSYSPMGGYTREQARTKYTKTKKMSDRTNDFFNWIRMAEPVRFVVPQPFALYSFPDIPDENGEPIYGIGFLSPKPSARFGIEFNNFLNGLNFKDEKEMLDKGIQRIHKISFYLAAAARSLHDLFGVYHRQFTLGNAGMSDYGLGSKQDSLVFIGDWDTVEELPQEKDANRLARALDLTKIWLSAKDLTDCLISKAGAFNSSSVPFAGYGVLKSVLNGYHWNAQEPQIGDYVQYCDYNRLLNSRNAYDYLSQMIEIQAKCLIEAEKSINL
jgi:hypothetical protein